MGYRSQIVLKTTTEGYILCQKFDDSIKNTEEKPLDGLTIKRTASGFYKISHDYIKWYDSYPSVNNFNKMLVMLEEQEIPFTFIRIGEDDGDVDTQYNYTDDMPDELSDVGVNIEIYDPDDYYEDL